MREAILAFLAIELFIQHMSNIFIINENLVYSVVVVLYAVIVSIVALYLRRLSIDKANIRKRDSVVKKLYFKIDNKNMIYWNVYQYLIITSILNITLFIIEWLLCTSYNLFTTSILNTLASVEVPLIITCLFFLIFFVRGVIIVIMQRNIKSIKWFNQLFNLFLNILIFMVLGIINFFILFTIVFGFGGYGV